MEKERIEELIKFTSEQKKQAIKDNIDNIFERIDGGVTYDEEEGTLKFKLSINEIICLESMDEFAKSRGK